MTRKHGQTMEAMKTLTAAGPDVAALVGALPEPDEPGKESKFTGPAPDEAWMMAGAILDGGRQSIIDLAALIRDSTGGGERGYKPGYALHCVALRVARPGEETARRLFCEALASRLGSAAAPKDVQAFLIHEIEAAGGAGAAASLGPALRDPELCDHAARALVAIRHGAGVELRGALPDLKGKPECRAAVIQALGVLGDGEAALVISEAAQDGDAAVRSAAVWALARIGDASAAEVVLRAADSSQGWERIQAAKACLLLAEQFSGAGKKEEARRIYRHLQETRRGTGEEYAAQAAVIGLKTLE